MASYPDPPADSPFLITPPVVVVVRHVRVTSADETVAEDGGALFRHWLRFDLSAAVDTTMTGTVFRLQPDEPVMQVHD